MKRVGCAWDLWVPTLYLLMWVWPSCFMYYERNGNAHSGEGAERNTEAGPMNSLPVVHSDHERAVNRFPPRQSSRHGALLAHELTVELSHSSSHGANRQPCHARQSTSIVRRNALWHSLARGS
eukprot:6418561-Prymnesium_polylepis.1